MSALGMDSVHVVRYVRNLRGSSSAILVEASDGLLYVVKLADNLESANQSFSESSETELYHACGLAVPSWKPLLVTDGFIDRNPGCWTQTIGGRLRFDSGLYFGSRFLGGPGVRLLEILPETSLRQVRNRESFWLAWLIDICAGHTDHRQAIFVEDAKGWFDTYFVNHRHLFGCPKWEQWQPLQSSRYLDQRIYPCLSSYQRCNFLAIAASMDVDRLWQTVQALPNDWKTKTTLKSFAECLGRLSDARLLQNILDTMMVMCLRSGHIERKGQQNERRFPRGILCPGVQAAGISGRLIANRVHHPASA